MSSIFVKLSSNAMFAVYFLIIVSTIILIRHYRSANREKIRQFSSKESSINRYYTVETASEDAQYKYYQFLREEIGREDNLTNQRLTWALSFQGFLISAVTILISFAWPSSGTGAALNASEITVMRRVSVVALPLVGLAFGHIAFVGILASRQSLASVKRHWEERNRIWGLFPDKVPQAFGQRSTFSAGSLYPLGLSLLFIVMWQIFLVIYVYVELNFWNGLLEDVWQDILSRTSGEHATVNNGQDGGITGKPDRVRPPEKY